MVLLVYGSLQKDVAERPNYARLLEHPFIAKEPFDKNKKDEVLSFMKGNLLEFAKDFGLNVDEGS